MRRTQMHQRSYTALSALSLLVMIGLLAFANGCTQVNVVVGEDERESNEATNQSDSGSSSNGVQDGDDSDSTGNSKNKNTTFTKTYPENPRELTDAQWRERLTKEQYNVARHEDTEKPFTNAYDKNKRSGVYRCVCCGKRLFDSKAKYDSGTGWPSFYQPIDGAPVGEKEDRRLFLGVRTEVICSNCDAHLGHVFDDGPEPTGLRYCLNSAALDFEERDEEVEPKNETSSSASSSETE